VFVRVTDSDTPGLVENGNRPYGNVRIAAMSIVRWARCDFVMKRDCMKVTIAAWDGNWEELCTFNVA
jgi:hypothetical protein